MSLSEISSSLLVRCQKGDVDSFESLFGHIKDDMYRIIYSFMHDHDDTDEVMQESLIRIFRYLPNLKDLEKFSSWVMRIVINQCHTHRTRKGRHACLPLDDLSEKDDQQVAFQQSLLASPRDSLIQSEVLGIIRAAIDELPRRQRSAILLFEIEGFSIREVAETMQCSEGAVKFNIHEARKKLQKTLSGEWNWIKKSLPRGGRSAESERSNGRTAEKSS